MPIAKLFLILGLFYSLCLKAEVTQFHFSDGEYITFNSETKVFELMDSSGCKKVFADGNYLSLISNDIHKLGRSSLEIDKAGEFVIQSALGESVETERPNIVLAVETSPESFDGVREQLNRRPRGSILGLGELEQIMVTLESNNDNLLHGGGRLLGVSKDNRFEGNDLGYTFGIALNSEAQFQNGSLNLNLRSDLYSRPVMVDGQKKDENKKNYVEDINVSVADVKLRRDLSGKYFVEFDVGFTTYQDQNGVALKIQNAYHEAARGQGLGGRLDNQTDHINDFSEISGGMAVGRRFTFHKSNSVEITGSVAVGAEVRQAIGTSPTQQTSLVPIYSSDLRVNIRNAVSVSAFTSQNSQLRESGADVFVPLVRRGNDQLQAYSGVSWVEPIGDHVRIYRDRDLNYRMGFRYVRKFGPR